LLKNAEVGAQAVANKSLLKAQVDGLAAEVDNLKAERAKAQELQQLHGEHLAEADAQEKKLQSRL
jgi:hypothetical protein